MGNIFSLSRPANHLYLEGQADFAGGSGFAREHCQRRLASRAWLQSACSGKMDFLTKPLHPAILVLVAVFIPITPLPAPAADSAPDSLQPAEPQPSSAADPDRTRLTLDPPATARFYGNLEYLVWWVKPGPLSVPLVSTGPISTTHHGFLDSSDTTILDGAPHSPAQ